jgi:phospholipase/carboxylesterase
VERPAELQARVRPASGDPEGALVLLHGRGVNMHDLLPLADALDPERRLVVVAPQAPLELSPGGFHWYIVPRVGFPDPDTFRATYELLARWLDGVPDALGVGLSRTVLGGFSQGAVMSYALGLGEGRPRPAALIALSGFIPTVEGWKLQDDLDGYPVAIGHGTHDPVMSIEFARTARAELERRGAAVLYRESPMAHSIDPAFLRDLQPWLAERLP